MPTPSDSKSRGKKVVGLDKSKIGLRFRSQPHIRNSVAVWLTYDGCCLLHGELLPDIAEALAAYLCIEPQRESFPYKGEPLPGKDCASLDDQKGMVTAVEAEPLV